MTCMLRRNNRDPWDAWIGLLILLIAIGAIFITLSVDRRSHRIDISVEDLITSFIVDDLGAAHYYSDRPLVLNGIVQHVIEENGSETIFMAADTDDSISVYHVMCTLQPDTEMQQISKGDQVTLLGTCEGIDAYSIIVSDCTIQ